MLYGCMSMHTLPSVHTQPFPPVLLCLFAAKKINKKNTHVDSTAFPLWNGVGARLCKKTTESMHAENSEVYLTFSSCTPCCFRLQRMKTLGDNLSGFLCVCFFFPKTWLISQNLKRKRKKKERKSNNALSSARQPLNVWSIARKVRREISSTFNRVTHNYCFSYFLHLLDNKELKSQMLDFSICEFFFF